MQHEDIPLTSTLVRSDSITERVQKFELNEVEMKVMISNDLILNNRELNQRTKITLYRSFHFVS